MTRGTRHDYELKDPIIATFLCSDTRMAIVWLIVRLYLGWPWLESGRHKVRADGWSPFLNKEDRQLPTLRTGAASRYDRRFKDGAGATSVLLTIDRPAIERFVSVTPVQGRSNVVQLGRERSL